MKEFAEVGCLYGEWAEMQGDLICDLRFGCFHCRAQDFRVSKLWPLTL